MDLSSLLAHWLNQVLFLSTVQGMVFSDFRVVSVSEIAIAAEADGELFDPGRHDVLRRVERIPDNGVSVERLPDTTWQAKALIAASRVCED